MEQAALHRMAKSIAQLTLCQVTGEETETATKLLEKACHKLRGIPEVPPQRITDLDNATRQLHQLSALSRQAMKSVKRRKLCCYCPVPKKDLALFRKSTTPTYRTLLTTMSLANLSRRMNTQESDFVNRDGFEQPNKTTQPPKMEVADIHAMMI